MNIKGKLRQFLGSSIMSFPKFLLASGFVWPSYALIILKDEDTPLGRPITLMEEALIGSLPLISSIITSPFGGAIVDKIGRKNTGVITVISIAISWALIAAIHNIPVLLIGRVVFGVSGGLLMQVAWSFTAEISEDSVRGFMSSMPSVMYAFGALISIILGWVSTYQNIIYINIALSIGNGLVMFLLPESPVYLNLIGKEEDAIKSLAFYRAASVSDRAVKDEMSIFKNQEENKDKASILLPTEEPLCLDAEKQNFQDCVFVPAPKVTGWRYFRKSPASRWSLFLAALLMTLSILTGVLAIQVYGGPLFLKATPSMSPDFCAVLLASILLIGSICGASFTDLFGRRVLLISASAVNGLCVLGLGTLVKWSWGPEWFIPALILIFCFVFNLGGGTIPYLLLAEIFVPEVKGFAQSIMMLWLYVVNFILLLAFVPAVELIGLDVVFFVFAGFAFLTTLCTHFMLPETKGMNPYAIEEMFTRRIKK